MTKLTGAHRGRWADRQEDGVSSGKRKCRMRFPIQQPSNQARDACFHRAVPISASMSPVSSPHRLGYQSSHNPPQLPHRPPPVQRTSSSRFPARQSELSDPHWLCYPCSPAPLQSLTCELAFGCDVTAAWRNEGEGPKTQKLRLAAPQQTTAHTRPQRGPCVCNQPYSLCTCLHTDYSSRVVSGRK